MWLKCLLFILFFNFSLLSYNVGLCITATNKYVKFIPDLITSARKFFLTKHNVTFYIFTDKANAINLSKMDDVVLIFSEHRAWPYSTLLRFKNYLDNFHLISHNDYLFATDADMLFVDFIDDEIFAETVGILHPGYYLKDKATFQNVFEKGSKSTAFISCAERYFAGGFYGGSSHGFSHIISNCMSLINKDLTSNYVAKWHDESYLNKYFNIINKPSLILGPSYCFPEDKKNYPLLAFIKPKLIAIFKTNHAEVRR